MDKTTAHREWIVDAAMVEHGDGLAQVRVQLTNGRAGPIPSFILSIDWKPGMEAGDVEIAALTLMADMATGLREACIDEGARRMARNL